MMCSGVGNLRVFSFEKSTTFCSPSLVPPERDVSSQNVGEMLSYHFVACPLTIVWQARAGRHSIGNGGTRDYLLTSKTE